MSKNNSIPVYSLNVPNGGIQQSITITSNTPIYSSYTGNIVSHGSISYGTLTDAPSNHVNHGKNFHVIEYNPANGSYMAHDYTKSK